MDPLLAAQICLRDAWPALEIGELSGWQLRAGRGGYNRINSVWPGRFSGTIPVNDAIDRGEAFYAARGLTPRFQMLGIAQPPDLDRLLEERGYHPDIPCSDLWKPVSSLTIPSHTTVSRDAPDAWIELYGSQQTPERAAEFPAILTRLPPSHGFIVHRREGQPIGVALVSRVGDDVAVDCVLTRAENRRTGAATTVMHAAEAWAAGEGALRILLSVIDSNTPAVSLYRKLGYRLLSAYHYRVKPLQESLARIAANTP